MRIGPVRRAVVASLIAAALAGMPGAAIAEPVRVFISETTHCFMTVSNSGNLELDQSLLLMNADADPHRINQRQGFWNVRVPGDTNRKLKMRAAGRFDQRCDSEPYDPDDTVRVPMKIGRVSGTTFKLRWALDSAPSGWRFAVRYKVGSGDLVTFKGRTALRSASFVAEAGKTYRFQAKAIRFGKSSGWSPLKGFTA